MENVDCINTDTNTNTEIDADETSLKTLLSRSCESWDDVCVKWRASYKLRQKDTTKINSIDFMTQWPKLIDARAPDLINIDFGISYPGKENILFTKWEEFKKSIKIYFESNLKNAVSKSLYNLTKSVGNIDSEDYILAILLNHIIKPTTRMAPTNSGKNKAWRRPSISDGEESMVLRLVTINNYENQVELLKEKYYEQRDTVQPFLLVVGNQDNINGFYVYFQTALYKSESFIKSWDLCFKIFNCYNLKYPALCQGPWILIQNYIYNISTTYDYKLVLHNLVTFKYR